jgi:hypothetical protein
MTELDDLYIKKTGSPLLVSPFLYTTRVLLIWNNTYSTVTDLARFLG